MPDLIATALRSDTEESILIPKKFKPLIKKTKVELNKQMDSIPKIMHSLNLTFDDLIYIAETIDANQVLQSIDEMNNIKLKNANQAFDIIKKNVTIKRYDVEIFRKVFIEKISLNKINSALKKINDNHMTTTMSIPVARQTIKQVLYDNREKLERKLESFH